MNLHNAFLLILLGGLPLNYLGATDLSKYEIEAPPNSNFEAQNSYQLIVHILEERPELKKRMLDRSYSIETEEWGYHSQVYGDESIMYHLLALQVKAMAERGAIKDLDEVLHPKYGIGSKYHKDKGTIGNPFSIWGHPVQTEILGQRSRLKALRVYHAFRKTIKNQLIHYGRNQSLEWHLQPLAAKKAATLEYLEAEFPEAVNQLETVLRDESISLSDLLEKALLTNLLS